MKNKLRMISIDCWGTILIDQAAWSEEIYTFVCDALGKHNSHIDDRVFKSAWEAENNLFVASLEQDHVTPHNTERVRRIAHSLGLGLSEFELGRIGASIDEVVARLPPQVRSGASEFLHDVHRRGLCVSVVSNTGWLSGEAVGATLRNLSLGPTIEHMFFSDVVGCAKPCRRIFEVALAACGCSSADCAHIGDTPATDIKGAASVRIHGIYLCPLDRSPGVESPCFVDFESIAAYLDRIFEFKSSAERLGRS
jgi:FMN phosphatase YigB (HAD superfamily)